MHRSGEDGALRHLDYALLDVICMQVSFMLMFYLMKHEGFLYFNTRYRTAATIFFSAQMALGLFSDTYNGIFKRTPYHEFTLLLQYVTEVWLLGGVFMLITGLSIPLMELFAVSVVFFDLDYFARHFNTVLHRKYDVGKRKVVLVTNCEYVLKTVRRFNASAASGYSIAGILLLDKEACAHRESARCKEIRELGIPVYYAYEPNIMETFSRKWIDDALCVGSEKTVYPKSLMENFLVMGVTIHFSLSELEEFSYARADVQEIGDFKVISNSISFVSDRALLLKRMLDILGGLAGTLVTGLLVITIGPLIYLKDPGPIFFAQTRIGMNGRTFKMYKFRSMYMDAEKRKAELMAKNKIQGGMMFKIDDDPRIIGSEKKGKDGKPKGIGNFIRNTSIDEFPQFINVLKGDMSLVGTRPPTLDEWEKYELHHRARMSAKPGITGMWQVSGRSKITDFEQVVELDRQYIENWSFLLDIKILIKTVEVVLKHDGAF